MSVCSVCLTTIQVFSASIQRTGINRHYSLKSKENRNIKTHQFQVRLKDSIPNSCSSDQKWSHAEFCLVQWNDVVCGVRRTEMLTRWVTEYRYHGCRDI